MALRVLRLLAALVLPVLAVLSGCGEAGAGGDRKEFRIIENQLRMRLEFHMAYNKRYPEELSELEEPEPAGYKLPKLPAGYRFDYDPGRGTVRVRAEGAEPGE